MISIANVGQTDKMLRLGAGIILGLVSFLGLGGLSSSLGIIALVVAAVLVITGALNFCPAYKALNLSTKKNAA